MKLPRERLSLAVAALALAHLGSGNATAASLSREAVDTLTLALEPSTVVVTATDHFVPYVLHVTDGKADSLELTVTWSDGSTTSFADEVLCAPEAQGGGIDRRIPLPHSFRHPGAQQLVITARTDGCDAGAESASITATAAVLPGAVTTNGPQRPFFVVQPFRKDPRQARRVATDLVLVDADGVPASVDVDWGDGSTSHFERSDCADPLIRYPSGRLVASPLHEYKRSGSYVVTLTGTASGCDGASRQQAARKIRIRVG